MSVAALSDELMPLLQSPSIGEGLARFNAESARKWNASSDDALLDLLAWIQSDEFEKADRAAQWDVFDGDGRSHDAGKRRLALWHARNSEIATRLHRASAQPRGQRVLLLIGAAHRGILESTVAAQPYVELVPSASLFEPRR